MLALMVLAAGLPKRAALLAGAVAAIYPAFVFQSSQMLTEVLHRFLQTGFLLCLVMATKRGCSRWLIAAGVLFSVAGLNKSTLFAAGPFVVAWLVAVRWNASGRKRALRDVLIFGGAAGIVLGAWTLRNATVSGRFIPVSSNFPITFSQGVTKHSWYTARWNDESELMAAPDDFLALTQLRSYRGVSEELAVGEEWAADARQFIGEKPGWFAALTFRKALHFWSPLIRNSLPARIVALVTMGPVLLLGWIWLFRHIRAAGPERRLAYLVLAIAIPVTLPHAISQPDVRYRLALVDPLWIVLGAALVDEFLRTHERHSEQAEGSS